MFLTAACVKVSKCVTRYILTNRQCTHGTTSRVLGLILSEYDVWLSPIKYIWHLDDYSFPSKARKMRTIRTHDDRVINSVRHTPLAKQTADRLVNDLSAKRPQGTEVARNVGALPLR